MKISSNLSGSRMFFLVPPISSNFCASQVFKREIGELGNSEGLGHAPENAIPPDEMERRSMAKRRQKVVSEHFP